MRKIIFSIFIFFILISLISPSFAQEVGKLTALQGRVDIMHEGKPPAVEAKLNQPVYLKDIIRTKTDSKAEVTFKDGTVIKIAQRSRVDISEYFTDGESLKARIELQRGRVGAYVSKESVEKISSSPKANRFEVKTPLAVAGVRGTNFIVSHHINPTTTVLVLSGKVYVYNINLPEQIVELHDGEMTIIKEKNPPTPPVQATPEDTSRYQLSLNLDIESLSPPVTEQINLALGHSSIIDMNSSVIWTDDLQGLSETGINATFSGDAFWLNTPAKVSLKGQITDSLNKVDFSSGKGYLWGGILNGHNSEYLYAGFVGGSLSPNSDMTYNMNAYIAGIYNDSSDNKGIFIGYMGKDGSSNISLTDKSFSLEGDITSAVTLGKGAITGVLEENLPLLSIVDRYNPYFTITHQESKSFPDTNDYNYTFGVLIYGMGGYYSSPSQNWFIVLQPSAPDEFFGLTVQGTLWGNENNIQNLLKGKTYGYLADDMNSIGKTGIIVGETIGTYNPTDYTWQAVTAAVFLETNTFLNLVSSDAGRQKLSSIGVPVVEIGRDTLTYQNMACSNCINSVTMSDVKFFASSAGNPPTIWATNQVNGIFNGTVPVNSYVTLTGTSVSATFTPKIWNSNYWIATISGSGNIGSYTIDRMDGYAAGTISGNSFSGTGAGAVKAH